MAHDHQVEIEQEDGTITDADGNPIVKDEPVAPAEVAPSPTAEEVEEQNKKQLREINIVNYYRGLSQAEFEAIKALTQPGNEEALDKYIRDTILVMGYSSMSGNWNNPQESLSEVLPFEVLETPEAFNDFFNRITKQGFSYEEITRHVVNPETKEPTTIIFYRGRVFVEDTHEVNIEAQTLEELVMNIYGLHHSQAFVPFRMLRFIANSRINFSQDLTWEEVEAALKKYNATYEDVTATPEKAAEETTEAESAEATVKAVEVNENGHELVRVQDILGKPTNIYHDPEIDAEYYIENGATVLL